MTQTVGPTIIVAMDAGNGIGRDNQMPWKIPEEMRHFRDTTSGHVVVMGRRTYESIGRPLPNRVNIVVTRQSNWYPFAQAREDLYVAYNLEFALDMATCVPGKRVFVIGGSELYRQALPIAAEVVATHVPGNHRCDKFFPLLLERHWSAHDSKEIEAQGFERPLVVKTYRRA